MMNRIAYKLYTETKKLNDGELLVIVRDMAKGGLQMNPKSKWAEALNEMADRYEKLGLLLQSLERAARPFWRAHLGI